MSSQTFIPFHRPEIGDAEIEEVVRTLRSGWLTTGVRTAQFENEFQTYVGAKHALAVNSGTAALHLALAGLNVGPGDEVITTPLTFCATGNGILHVGAARALYVGHHVGADCFPSDAVAFSFYASKNLTTGEGGMVVTNRDVLACRIKILTLHGISKDAWNRYGEEGGWYYEVLENGFKYNLTDIQSAIGIHQLRKLERFIEQRTHGAELYDRALGDMEELELPKPVANGRHSWHLYILRLNLDLLTIDRARFISELRSRKVGASVHFIPIFLHPFFKQWANLLHNQCPRSLELYPRLVSLPLYPAMTEEEVSYVARSVREIVAEHSKRNPIGSSWSQEREARIAHEEAR